MSSDRQNLPVPDSDQASRVDRVERVIRALSEFEQDELQARLAASHLQRTTRRLADKRNLLALGVHTGLLSAVIFGLITGLVTAIVTASQAGIGSGIGAFLVTLFVGGGVFGLFMGLYVMLIVGVMMPRLAKNVAKQQSAIYHSKTIDLDAAVALAFKVCRETVSSRKGWKIETIDEPNLSLQAVTGWTVRSPGELVGVRVEPVGEHSCRVRVASRALFTAMDVGQNRRNVEMLAREIATNIEAHRLLLQNPIE